MEKKLRTKFTILSVGAFFIALGLISSALIYANYSKIVKQADSMIERIISYDSEFDMPKNKLSNDGRIDKDTEGESWHDEYDMNGKMPDSEDPFFSFYFAVKFNQDKSVSNIDVNHIYGMSMDDAKSYAVEILSKLGNSTDKSGFFYTYRYKSEKLSDGYICVFLDCSRDLDLLKEFIKNNILIAVLSLLCISLISWLLSKRAVLPLVSAYEKQKEFITNASHELKTPLAIISANNDIIEIENGESKWLTSNKNQIKRLSGMIEMLVTLTKLDEAAYVENAAPVDISELLHSSVDGFSPLAEAQEKSFYISAPDSLVAKVNYDEIKKLFYILLENSIKYSKENSTISAILTVSNGDGNSKGLKADTVLRHFSFSIENAAKNLQKGSYDILFDRFYRLDASRNSETGGFGIGLSIAKAIAEKHGGSIKAYSPDGDRMVIELEI